MPTTVGVSSEAASSTRFETLLPAYTATTLLKAEPSVSTSTNPVLVGDQYHQTEFVALKTPACCGSPGPSNVAKVLFPLTTPPPSGMRMPLSKRSFGGGDCTR